MLFVEIAGQKKIKKKLTDIVNKQKLSQAYLFIEQEGQGALPLAYAFAQYINCENKDLTSNDSCGTCNSCLLANNFSYPDFGVVYPVINKENANQPPSTSRDYIKQWNEFLQIHSYFSAYDWFYFIDKKNKQGNIFSSECSQIIQKLSLKSFAGNYKIQIIWLVEYLNKDANRLLKILEEPPDKTIFILITQNKHIVLDTVLSRTQQFVLENLDANEIIEYLLQKDYLKNDIENILPFVEGNLRKAFQLLKEDSTINFNLLKNMMNTIFINKTIQQLDWVKAAVAIGREGVKNYLLYCLEVFQLVQKQLFINIRLPENELGILVKTMSQKISKEHIWEATTLIEFNMKLIDRNADLHMLLHAMLLKFHAIFLGDKTITVQ